MIADRIRTSLETGQLRQLPDPATFQSIEKMGDLLRHFEEMFPGVILDEDGNMGALRRRSLKFVPQPRRSARPVPLPVKMPPMPQPDCRPGLFRSVQAVWEWYQEKDKAAARLLEHTFDEEGLTSFLDPLFETTRLYWPLGARIDDYGFEEPVASMEGFSLLLPFMTYDDECAGTVEAFLSGAEAIASRLSSLHLDKPQLADRIELPEADEKLIAKVGWAVLMETYAKFPGEKSVDVLGLENWGETHFGWIESRFPEHADVSYAVISGDGGSENDVWIHAKSDIDFCLAWAESYYKMMDAFPDPQDFDYNEGGITETFIHEVCEVWRKENGKRSVKWTSPKSKTLQQRFKRGEL